MLRNFILTLALTPLLHAQEPPTDPTKPEAPAKPAIEKISETQFKIGKIILDKKTREITFDAKFEQTQDNTLLEFLLTTPNGKIHETLLTAEIDPHNLNIALKLLGYKESRELFRMLDDRHRVTEKYFQVDAPTKAASRLDIQLTFKKDGKDTSVLVNEVIQSVQTQKSMDMSPWINGGSLMTNGKFHPSLTGDIIAIFTDRASMLNYSGDKRDDDTNWQPFAKRLAPIGTPVKVTLKPHTSPAQPLKK